MVKILKKQQTFQNNNKTSSIVENLKKRRWWKNDKILMNVMRDLERIIPTVQLTHGTDSSVGTWIFLQKVMSGDFHHLYSFFGSFIPQLEDLKKKSERDHNARLNSASELIYNDELMEEVVLYKTLENIDLEKLERALTGDFDAIEKVYI